MKFYKAKCIYLKGMTFILKICHYFFGDIDSHSWNANVLNNGSYFFWKILDKEKKLMILDLILRNLGTILLLHEIQKPFNH